MAPMRSVSIARGRRFRGGSLTMIVVVEREDWTVVCEIGWREMLCCYFHFRKMPMI